MKPVPRLVARARTQPLLMLLCGVASIAVPILLSAYVDTLNVAVQRGEELRRVQRAGGVMSSADAVPGRQPDSQSDAQASSVAGRVSRAVRAS
jgi:hypothetical protein